MHIRTPRRYRGKRQNIFRRRTILMLILIGLLGGAGGYIWQNMATLQPLAYEVIGTAIVKAQDQAMTIVAPTATATKDPRNDLISGNNAWASGTVSEALRIYQPILASIPNDEVIHYRVTLGLIIQGNYNEAVDYAEMTVNADPYSSDAWAIRAWALDWDKRSSEAIASAQQARDLDPNNAKALAFLAEALYGVDQGTRAFTTADQAIALDKNSPEAYRARGYLYQYINGDSEKAFADYTTAYELAAGTNPAFAGLIAVNMAEILVAQGNHQGAIDRLEEIRRTNPGNIEALRLLGVLYMTQMGDPATATTYLQDCVDIAPESIECNYQLGRAQEKNKLYPSAADSLNRAIQLGSTNPQHYYWAASVQISLGNCSSALNYIETGYELDQNNDRVDFLSDFDYLASMCGGGTFGQPTQPAATQEATSEPDI